MYKNTSLWEFFKRKKKCEQKQLLKATTSNVYKMRASFLVVNCIVKTKKLFTIGEELILPASENTCYEFLGEIAFEVMVHIPLSASSINR